MKKILTIQVLVMLIFMSACSTEEAKAPEDANPKIASIYNMAFEQELVDQTYEEWLESIAGEDGREVTLRVEDGMLQWSYLGESPWFELFNLNLLKGPSGDDGASAYELYTLYNPNYAGTEEDWVSAYDEMMEVSMSYDLDMLEIMSMLDEILENTQDNSVLTDDEINYYLSNLDEHVTLLIPNDLNEYYNDDLFENECLTSEYDVCYDLEDYPSIYGSEFLDFHGKMGVLSRIEWYSSIISNQVGEYDSTPIVPNRFLSNQNTYIDVEGRNSTSLLLSGTIDSSAIDIPGGFVGAFNFELLIYKDVVNDEIIVESYIDVTSGISFLEFSVGSFHITSSYMSDGDMIDTIYTTKLGPLSEWKTLVVPTDENSIEIIASNGTSIEYFDIDDGVLSIMHSEDWMIESPNYTLGVYDYEGMIYEYDSGLNEFVISLNQLEDIVTIDYLADEPIFSSNEYKVLISFLDGSIVEKVSPDEELENIWIFPRNSSEFYLGGENYKDKTIDDVLVLVTNDLSLIDSFFENEVNYPDLLADSIVEDLYNYVDVFTYDDVVLLSEDNIEVLIQQFYLD